MNQRKNEEFIEKVKIRASKSLKIKEVFLDSEIFEKANQYLRVQKYLEYNKVEKILKNYFEPNHPLGYVMIDNNEKIVGFMGTIFSKKNIDKRIVKLCNIHSWIVDKDYRLNAFYLLTSLPEEDIIFTAFTPVKTLIGLLEKFDFKKMKMNLNIVAFFNFSLLKKQKQFFIERKIENFKNKLSESDLNILKNYKNLPYEKFVIINKKQNLKPIFIIASKIKKKGFNILKFIYVSNKEEFKKKWYLLKSNIQSEFNVNLAFNYFFDEKDNIFPSNIILSKTLKKEVCIKNFPENKKLDILYSDLVE